MSSIPRPLVPPSPLGQNKTKNPPQQETKTKKQTNNKRDQTLLLWKSKNVVNPIIPLVTENIFSQTTILKKYNDEQSQTVINQNWISVDESDTKANISK